MPFNSFRISRTESSTTNGALMYSSFFFLYFVQGMPYGLQTRFLPIFFRIHGMSLSSISLYKLLLIPWVLKTLWGPIIDKYGTRNIWLNGSLLCLCGVCIGAAFSPPDQTIQLAAIMFSFNIITSVQDVALDSLVMESLSAEQLGKGNIAQVVGYKTGALFSGGVFSLFTESLFWDEVFYGLAAIYFAAYIVSVLFVPKGTSGVSLSAAASMTNQLNTSLPGMEDINSVPHVPNSSSGTLSIVYFYLNRIFSIEGTSWMLIYLIFYKIGEQGILNMFPMLLLDKKISPQIVGFWTGFVGQSCSVIGSVLGGLSFNFNTFSLLKFYLVLRGLAALVIWLCLIFWEDMDVLSYTASVICFMIVFASGGAISTRSYTILMHLSKKAPRMIRSSHYSILVTGDTLGRILFSAAIGSIAQMTSFTFVFGMFFVLCLLALVVLRSAPRVIKQLNN